MLGFGDCDGVCDGVRLGDLNIIPPLDTGAIVDDGDACSGPGPNTYICSDIGSDHHRSTVTDVAKQNADIAKNPAARIRIIRGLMFSSDLLAEISSYRKPRNGTCAKAMIMRGKPWIMMPNWCP